MVINASAEGKKELAIQVDFVIEQTQIGQHAPSQQDRKTPL
jgi:hypothetical protein